LRLSAQLAREIQQDLHRMGIPSPDGHAQGVQNASPVLAEHLVGDGFVRIAGYEGGQLLRRQPVLVLGHRYSPPFTLSV
jgi:hypothetical protein